MAEKEQQLAGGRVTDGVAKRGNCVLRPLNTNSARVHRVLQYLERKGIDCAPRFIGIEGNREILSYVPGEVPDNLGEFTDGQLTAAARIIRRLHDALNDMPELTDGQTMCHNDLSPCNFTFVEGMPVAVIDWDACAPGDARDDMAYAAWMWLDIGNDELEPAQVKRRVGLMLDEYGLAREMRAGFEERILRQMKRVGDSIFPTQEQTRATHDWAYGCADWLKKHGAVEDSP